MKLLIIYHSGLADDAKHIFREYVRQGIDLKVIVPQKNGRLVYSLKDNEESFAYIPLKFDAGFNIFSLFSAIKKVNPDVIHVIDEYTVFPLFQTVLCRNALHLLGNKKIPIFSLSFQNLPFTSPPFVFRSPVAFLRRATYKTLLPFIMHYHKSNLAGIVGGNKEALQILKDIGVNVPMKLILWGVNVNLFFSKNRDACREKLGLPKDVKLIGYFGKMMKEKGLEHLARATSQLPQYHLLLVGNGNYKAELHNLIASLKIQDRVHFHDSVALNELGDYYSCLNAYVLPTYTTENVKEQYGRVLVEAMACKIPVIGSTCGAIADVLHGYPAHLIFNEYSLPDLIDKIKKIENMPMPKDFDMAKFLHKFSVENFVTENIKFYQDVQLSNM